MNNIWSEMSSNNGNDSDTEILATGVIDRFAYDGISGRIRKEYVSSGDLIELYINSTLISKTPLDPPKENEADISFQIGVFDVWRFAQKHDSISVHHRGEALRMPSGNLFEHPAQNGKEDLERLRTRLSDGQAFDSSGRITNVGKDQDYTWQDGVLTLYHKVDEIIYRTTGTRSFIYSGTLLGYVRDNGFIAHDKDMDCAYVSGKLNYDEVEAEFVALADALIAAGYDVNPKASCISVRLTPGSAVMVDIAHLFVKSDNSIGFPFGTVGIDRVTIELFEPVMEGQLAGFSVGIPAQPEGVVEQVYGHDWMIPNPKFNWSRDRRRRDMQTLISRSNRTRISMDDYYSKVAKFTPSTFSTWLVESKYASNVNNAIDVGCGNGRDIPMLSLIANKTIGFDRSVYAVAAARALTDHVSNATVFEGDVLSPNAFSELVLLPIDSPKTLNLFYCRFLLNGFTDIEQDLFIRNLADATRPGDLVAFEHRTTQDEKVPKAILRSFRRYVSTLTLSQLLRVKGFEILHSEEGTGLAQFQHEDPQIVRLIAKRI